MSHSHWQMVILDRDGVINQDSPDYILGDEQFFPIPGSLPAIAQLNQQGIIVVVATNQSAIGRGMLSETTLEAIHSKLQNQLTVYGGWLDSIYHCPHRPDEQCYCRKPQPGLIRQALQDWQIEPEHTLLVGDSWRDIQPALQYGCDTALVKTGNGLTTLAQHSDKLTHSFQADNLADLIKRLF